MKIIDVIMYFKFALKRSLPSVTKNVVKLESKMKKEKVKLKNFSHPSSVKHKTETDFIKN